MVSSFLRSGPNFRKENEVYEPLRILASGHFTEGEQVMLSSARFRVNDKQVVHEIFDGEVLVINLETGTYYSLLGSAARIWTGLVGGASIASMTQALGAVYEGDPAVIEAAVVEFVSKLAQQSLLVPDEMPAPQVAVEIGGIGGPKAPFAAPTLDVFTDMQDLLLLDPIHDVEEAGWPVVKPQAGKEVGT